jgi:hypothetical protein
MSQIFAAGFLAIIICLCVFDLTRSLDCIAGVKPACDAVEARYAGGAKE